MFGGGGPQEDMFAKLESMREIITEVNTQFKNPVRASRITVHLAVLDFVPLYRNPLVCSRELETLTYAGQDDIRLRVHL
jgi:hypothetical protein